MIHHNLNQVMCNFKSHQGESVASLCLRPQCKANSACCSQCQLQFHRECLDHLQLFKQIPELIDFTQRLQSSYENLVLMVTSLLKQVREVLDSLLKPINKYKESPNLVNLNELGDLLKQNPEQNIRVVFEQSKERLIEESKIFLNNLTSKVNEIQKAQALKWFEKYQEAQTTDWQYALYCIEKAIELDKLNGEYWHQNGLCLQYLKRLEEAIAPLTKSIQIQPTSQIYAEKSKLFSNQVFILELLNKLDQAKNCCEEGLRQFSDDLFLNFRYNSIKIKINSKK